MHIKSNIPKNAINSNVFTYSDNFIYTIIYGSYKQVLETPVEHQDLVRDVQNRICLYGAVPEVLFWCRHLLTSYLCVWTGSNHLKLTTDLRSAAGSLSDRFLRNPMKEAVQRKHQKTDRRTEQTSDMEENEKAGDLERRVL